MTSGSAKAIGTFFDEKWHLYQRAIRADFLCHREMFATLNRLLVRHFKNRTFRFADFGCGDATAVIDTLRDKPITHYTGVDAGADLIEAAAKTLASLDCQKQLICQDMATAITVLPFSVDVILCSYSLHHLLPDQKIRFIQDCRQQLNSPGFLIIVDGIIKDGETREEWLHRMEARMKEKVPALTDAERAQLMQHPRDSDYPETIAFFQQIAERWQNFEVLVQRDDFVAFMVFTK